MKARELFKMLEDAGWVLDRIDGSHHIFVKNGHHVSVKGLANNTVSPGLVRQALKKMKEVGQCDTL